MSTRRITGLALFVLCLVAAWMLNRRGAWGEITPRPLLYLVADTEREAERLPLELTRVSDEQENEIGDELARSEGLRNVPESQRTDEYKRVTTYLNHVGGSLTGNVSRPAIRYRFYYIPEDYFVNAAAMPGGQIVVGRGLLRLLDTEDELAAILGHEIAHVDARHSIERMQYEMKARQLGLGGMYQLGAPAIQLFESGYTKEQEADADRMGLEFAVNAGYSPKGAIDAMQRLLALEPHAGAPANSPVEEVASMPPLAMEEYFRSHPPTAERIAAFEKQIADEHWDPNRTERPLGVRAIFRTEEAAALDRKGEFQKAIALYRDAIRDDGVYAPARRGLIRALWRSGDAVATTDAAINALNLGEGDEGTWHLLALSAAAKDCKNAPDVFAGAVSTIFAGAAPVVTAQRVEADGLAIFCNDHAEHALQAYEEVIAQTPGVARAAELRIAMAGWMYRAGDLDEALSELDAANQESPSTFGTQVWRAWVLSDLGRQADAQNSLSGLSVDPAERYAVSALIQSRTEQTEMAQKDFASATQEDPVWMETNWVAHNYSRKAAAVFSNLRASEIARRQQEEAKRRHDGKSGPR